MGTPQSRTWAWQAAAGLVLFGALLGNASAAPRGGKVEVKADTYPQARETQGIVVLAVDWGRRWNFCGAENIQLRTFAFDRTPVLKHGDKEAADLVLDAPPSLTAEPGSAAYYALVLEPGEYALSYSELKIARSVSNVDTYAIGRKALIADGNSRAGSFTVGAGELVYIGHFGTDCIDGEPRIWRYYIQGYAGFKWFLTNNLKPKYPFLDTDTIHYKLLKTTEIGTDYELQCYFAPSGEETQEGQLYDDKDCVSD